MEFYNFHSMPAAFSSTSPSPDYKPPAIDTPIFAAAYIARSSDLRRVNAPFDFAGDELADYNPSDLSSWFDSGLPVYRSVSPYSNPYPNPAVDYSGATWTAQITSPQPLKTVTDAEEDSGIRLVHALLTCAESVQRGDLPFAAALLDDMKRLLELVDSTRGIGKVAGHFIEALFRRLYDPPAAAAFSVGFEHEILYHHFYEACPYLKFAHFTANQAILEAFKGHDRVHVIDFGLMQGLQWPPLIQALALRPGGPPSIKLTGIGSPNAHEVGLKLGQLARSVNIRFTFHSVTVTRLQDVEPWKMVHVDSDEAVAVNSILELHRVLGSDPGQCMARDPARHSAIDSVLEWIKALNPKVFTLVEQEASHNGPGYLDRFTEALHYYSTMFDSLEACRAQPEKALAEVYIQREICNVLSCEGPARVERHEPLVMWRARLFRAGFGPLDLGLNAYKQASMLLTLFSAEGYCVEEREGCLTLGWHGRPLIAASAWQVGPVSGPIPANGPV